MCARHSKLPDSQGFLIDIFQFTEAVETKSKEG